MPILAEEFVVRPYGAVREFFLSRRSSMPDTRAYIVGYREEGLDEPNRFDPVVLSLYPERRSVADFEKRGYDTPRQAEQALRRWCRNKRIKLNDEPQGAARPSISVPEFIDLVFASMPAPEPTQQELPFGYWLRPPNYS